MVVTYSLNPMPKYFLKSRHSAYLFRPNDFASRSSEIVWQNRRSISPRSFSICSGTVLGEKAAGVPESSNSESSSDNSRKDNMVALGRGAAVDFVEPRHDIYAFFGTDFCGDALILRGEVIEKSPRVGAVKMHP